MEPLGQSQVLNYLKKLSEDYQIYLITYEKKEDLSNSEKLKLFNQRTMDHGIYWIKLRYHFNFKVISTIYDVLLGFFVSFFLFTSKNIEVLHVRSTIPGFIAKLLSVFFTFKLIFDMRGFWSEEKADRSGWSRKGILFKFFNNLESNLIQISDSIVTLTDNAISIILSKNPYLSNEKLIKITTCTDLNSFKKKKMVKKSRQHFVLGHLGSVHTAYDIDPILHLYKILRRKFGNFRLLFLNRGSHQYINDQLDRFNISREGVEIISLDFNEVPKFIEEIDFGCFYAKPNLSIKASMPTKLGEFLACGVPILCNPINSDVSELVQKNEVGIISNFDSSTNVDLLYEELYRLAYSDDVQNNCRKIAELNFDVEVGVEKYRMIYRTLFGKD